MEANITWFDFLKIGILLIVILITLKLGLQFLPQIFKRKSNTNKLKLILNRIIEIYKPLAILILLLSFVSINYKVHGILFVVFLVITFSHIKRYLYGVLFKLNPLIEIGSKITTGEFKGDISKFLLFGIIINEEDGNRFINYSYIDDQGFSINQNDITSVRRTIYILEQEDSTSVLDLLFENPNIDHNNKPIIRRVPNKNILQLQVALLSGATMDSLISYLNQHDIKTSTTKN